MVAYNCVCCFRYKYSEYLAKLMKNLILTYFFCWKNISCFQMFMTME